MRTRKLTAFVAMGMLWIASRNPVYAQPNELYTFSPSGAGWLGGRCALSIDGQRIFVGAPKGAGAALLLDLATGLPLLTFGPPPGSSGFEYGWSVAIHGDLAIVGHRGGGYGSAHVYNLLTGQKAWTFKPPGPVGSLFGSAVAIDGTRAYVGAPWDDFQGSTNEGSVWAFDLSTGQALYQVRAPDHVASAYFGWSLAVDAGLLAVGAQNHGNSGKAYILDPATGQSVLEIKPSDLATDYYFGRSIALDDGRLLVGAPGAGRAYGIDAADGKVVFTLSKGGDFGAAVGLADGRAIVGNPKNAGSAWVFNALTGEERFQLTPSSTSPSNLYGSAVAIHGDRAIATAMTANNDQGLGFTFDIGPAPFVPYGTGCSGTGGVTPSLVMTGAPTLGASIQLAINEGVGSGMAFIFLGLQQAELSMGYGCTLNVAPVLPAIVGPIPLFPFGAQGPGAGSISFSANLPSLVPVPIAAQAFVVDHGVPSGFSNTNGVLINFY